MKTGHTISFFSIHFCFKLNGSLHKTTDKRRQDYINTAGYQANEKIGKEGIFPINHRSTTE